MKIFYKNAVYNSKLKQISTISLDSENFSESSSNLNQINFNKNQKSEFQNLIKSIAKKLQSPNDIYICEFDSLQKLSSQIPKQATDPNQIIELLLQNATKQNLVKTPQCATYYALHESIYETNSHECEAYFLDSENLPNPHAQIYCDVFLYAQKICPQNCQKTLYIAQNKTLFQIKNAEILSSIKSDSENLQANIQMFEKVFGKSELIQIEYLDTQEILEIAQVKVKMPALHNLATEIKSELQNYSQILKHNKTAYFQNLNLFFQPVQTRTLRNLCTATLLIFCTAYPFALHIKAQNIDKQINALKAQTYDLQALETPIKSQLEEFENLQAQNKNAKDKITFFLNNRQVPLSADLNDFFKLAKKFSVQIQETSIAKGFDSNAIEASITAADQTAITNLLSALNEKWSAQVQNIAYADSLAQSQISIICQK